MLWIILTFAFGWLLCGAWAIRMGQKSKWISLPKAGTGFVFTLYAGGPVALVVIWCSIWPARLWKFCKGVAKAWREAKEN